MSTIQAADGIIIITDKEDIYLIFSPFSKWNPLSSCRPIGEDSNSRENTATRRIEIPTYPKEIITTSIKLYKDKIYYFNKIIFWLRVKKWRQIY